MLSLRNRYPILIVLAALIGLVGCSSSQYYERVTPDWMERLSAVHQVKLGSGLQVSLTAPEPMKLRASDGSSATLVSTSRADLNASIKVRRITDAPETLSEAIIRAKRPGDQLLDAYEVGDDFLIVFYRDGAIRAVTLPQPMGQPVACVAKIEDDDVFLWRDRLIQRAENVCTSIEVVG